jgi:two-component system chemotaxis response regulator CheB
VGAPTGRPPQPENDLSDARTSNEPDAAERSAQQSGRPRQPAVPRVVVADDSAFMRRLIADSLMRKGVKVLAEVTNGREAIDACAQHRPDVLCLDLAMPELDGIAVLGELAATPREPGDPELRVVVISSFSEDSGMRAVDALAAGAFDLVPKLAGRGKLGEFTDQVVRTVFAATESLTDQPGDKPTGETTDQATGQTTDQPGTPATAQAADHANGRPGTQPSPRTSPATARPHDQKPPAQPRPADGTATATERLVLIASSTGGPRALSEVVPKLPPQIGRGLVIVQHMPAGFTRSLATRLNDTGDLKVQEAAQDDRIDAARGLVAPGGRHLRIRRRRAELSDEPAIGGLRPCADVTIDDAVAEYGGEIVLVVLTGMGRDACEGAQKVKAAGGVVLAEDPSTCTVFGMPRAVIEAGLADEVVPIDQMAAAIARHAQP